MDVLWSKDKLHKIFSKDSLAMTINVHASGDNNVTLRSCRLCNGQTNLKVINETYICEGIEERYDVLLYDCFGVKVYPQDCLICENCVRQLRNINHFRSLVHDAFVRQLSNDSSKHSQFGIGEGYLHPRNKTKDDNGNTNRLKDVVKLRKGKSKTITVQKKREIRNRWSSIMNTNIVAKRMNISCMICKQRYPMIVPFEGWKEFTCSRCKKKREVKKGERCKLKKASSIMRDRLALRSKADLRGRSGPCCLSKRTTQPSKTEDTSRVRQQKYECSLCPKKYIVAQHLAHHMSTVHGDKESFECTVCSKDLSSKDALEKHIRMHTGQPVYQCDVCLKTYKGKRSFQAHYLTHGK